MQMQLAHSGFEMVVGRDGGLVSIGAGMREEQAHEVTSSTQVPVTMASSPVR